MLDIVFENNKTTNRDQIEVINVLLKQREI